MHRDKKVGLALAILLCSIVGAFFFRDDAPRNSDPQLKNGQKIDEGIARDNPRGPYSETENRPRGNDPRQPAVGSRNGFNQNDMPAWMREDAAAGNSTTQRNRVNGSRDPQSPNDRSGGSSDITTLTPPPQDAPVVPIPLHNADWDTANNDSATARRNGTNVSPLTAGQKRTHVVADGETLSSIAGKYLGSQARYQEIFQANQDQLKSANDLKIGMKLTIPDRVESRSASGTRGTTNADRTATDRANKTNPPATNSPSRVTERANEPADGTTGKPKFKPAKPSSALRRTTDASEEESLGKKLSQRAPGDLLEIDDGVLAELEREMEPRVAEKPADVVAPK